MTLDYRSTPEAKIECFRSLFRGRADVYARRFENSRTGRSGYSPACGNEWVKGVCEKPRIKCSDCPHQKWLPFTDEVIRWHLEGHAPDGSLFVAGVYPMLVDETCFFLAADFDGEHWRDDVGAFREVCAERNVPAAVERSRSGNGAHVWIFFEQAVSAALARRLGAHLLTETLDRMPGVGLASYDRFFPNQDTLPRGGFGNLIALPLQKAPRDRGNSVFLDDEFIPYGDQWEYLSGVRKLGSGEVESLVESAERGGRVLPVRVPPEDDFALEPWKAPASRNPRDPPIAGPLPDSVELVVADQIYVPKEGLPPALRNRLVRLAAFQNPEFYRAQAMRLSTFGKPRIIGCADDLPAHIGLPRGCLDELLALLKELKIPTDLRDERHGGIPIEVKFSGALRREQTLAAEAMLKHDTGVLAATTAFGKTVLAAWLIASRGVNTLVLVHRQQLMAQWVERLSEFLGIPAKSIGCLGGGRRKLRGVIDVALLQSLARKGTVDDRVGDYGHLVFDECHHLPAQSFEMIARRAKAKYITGLSATVARKDGHHPIIFMQCGPVRHRVNAKEQARTRPFTHHVIVRPTDLRTELDFQEDPRVVFQEICDSILRDEKRNAMICADIAETLAEGRCPLVLTERTEHLETLVGMLMPLDARIIPLRGGTSKRDLRDALEALRQTPEDVQRVVVATGKFVGEGFDDPRLDTLFLAMPVSWRGTLTQYVGRLHRLHAGKREVRVFDYADLGVPMLERMFRKRCAGYESLGYEIVMPGSAVPGWPCEVPLPVDPEWKSDYVASVRRLVRDGIDAELADLFVRAAQSHPGPGHARSAAEAFLHRRLESLPETGGLFCLNAEIQIPFDRRGLMEVDLLWEQGKLAIEIDGPQHLADEAAWRRDRRKDMLLQRHGYLILRFLAADIPKDLDSVLDTIRMAVPSRLRVLSGS